MAVKRGCYSWTPTLPQAGNGPAKTVVDLRTIEVFLFLTKAADRPVALGS